MKRVLQEEARKKIFGEIGTPLRDSFEENLKDFRQGDMILDIITIPELQYKIHQNAVDKGFYDNPDRNVGEALMLIVGEVSEAMEAHQTGRFANWELYNSVYADEHPMTEADWTKQCFERHIKNTLEDELADAVIRIMDLCGYLNIDLEAHILAKMQYNSTREKLHGKLY
jgi:NTP pyrophosphatase (non-canonical NTP hydrolase)